ncbi:MAG: UDP-N-acetylmuramoyl-L-alanyl-D-glutamate--2,6-diaminopimelate ligase [Candidatus Gracilibacteria bacterium]|nr:UDP-N-acetylmuramoyl-L-alanyl-D-glutamate--2,6-diaminopimelate ligase [Candidatus Gracilibacteria bacterium]
MKNLKKLISLDNPIRMIYHKIKAIIAAYYYGFPASDMIVIGITGTNGKTTTTNIVARALREAGERVFMFSTINYMINGVEYVNNFKMTTPSPFLLQKLLKEAKDAGCKYAVIETSSHSLFYSRVWGIDYDIAVLTNVTQDHLDLHGTMENYVKTKLELFRNLIRFKRKQGIKKTAIINYDSAYKDLFLNETYDSLYTYGSDLKVDLRAENIENKFDGTSFSIRIAGNEISINTRLRGDFNIYNIMAAIGVLLSLAIQPKVIEKAISNITFIAGRLEEVENIEGIKIFVDYAHTADALENVLQTIRKIEGINKIITVFGATGDRDKTKRPIMGKVVSDLSDVVILTQDDDYSEKTEDIIDDVRPGIDRKEGEDFWIITDRENAIKTAIIMRKPGDVVLVAGKGDEHLMITNQGPIIWHDKDIIGKILNEIDENKIV